MRADPIAPQPAKIVLDGTIGVAKLNGLIISIEQAEEIVRILENAIKRAKKL